MDKTDRLRDYGLAFLLYEQGLGVCGYELIRELFIFVKLILNSYLGDYLPISTFFYEIWVKNRPFLQLFTKQVICYNLALHPIPIGIMSYPISGNHRKMNRLTMRNRSTKAGELVTKNCIVILIYHKLIL